MSDEAPAMVRGRGIAFWSDIDRPILLRPWWVGSGDS
jgi:hypothetical protein